VEFIETNVIYLSLIYSFSITNQYFDIRDRKYVACKLLCSNNSQMLTFEDMV